MEGLEVVMERGGGGAAPDVAKSLQRPQRGQQALLGGCGRGQDEGGQESEEGGRVVGRAGPLTDFGSEDGDEEECFREACMHRGRSASRRG